MKYALVWRRAILAAMVGASLAGTLGGCVSRTEYDKLGTTRLSEAEQLRIAQRRVEDLEAELEAERGSRTRADAALAELRASYNQALADRDSAFARLADFDSRLGSVRLGDLDPATDAALRDLAARYPNVLSYDPDRGMLRFASDMTFDSGSDAVRAEARQSLQQLAEILKGVAANYDLMVVGHTDSQRISAGTAQRHATNMHLSAHRAISVRTVLREAGINPERMCVQGWGEFRPAVANSANGNTPQNRRVEIYLAPGTHSASASAEAAPDQEQPPARPFDTQK